MSYFLNSDVASERYIAQLLSYNITTHTLCCPLTAVDTADTTSSTAATAAQPLPPVPPARQPPPALAVQMKSGAPVPAAATSAKRSHCNDEHWVALLAAPLWQTLSGSSVQSSS
jgi:hypothetical protein